LRRSPKESALYPERAMAMSRTDRIKLKTQIVERLSYADWPWDRQQLLMDEFGIEAFGDHDVSHAQLLADIPDDALLEMYSIVLDVETPEIKPSVSESTGDGNWKPGYLRLFLSHSARHKQFVGEIADELAVVGIDGFVAHNTMEVTKPWQGQIEMALNTMQAFVAIVHPEFNKSGWCHEEVGWALGRQVPHYVVRIGADPAAFIGRDQWPSCSSGSASQVATTIITWATGHPGLGEPIFDGMLEAIRLAGNYHEAGMRAERLAAFGTPTEDQFDRIDLVWWGNDQLHGCILASKALKPLYEASGREWPPTKREQTVNSA